MTTQTYVTQWEHALKPYAAGQAATPEELRRVEKLARRIAEDIVNQREGTYAGWVRFDEVKAGDARKKGLYVPLWAHDSYTMYARWVRVLDVRARHENGRVIVTVDLEPVWLDWRSK